jgi:hydrogenase-4 component E
MTSAGILSDLLLASAVLPVLVRQVRPGVVALALQGVLLAIAAAVYHPDAAGFVAAGLVVLTKVIAVPSLLYRTTARATAFALVERVTPFTYLGVVGVLLAVRLLSPQVASATFGPSGAQLASAALAATMLGLLFVATRRFLPSQMLGLALTENGLYAAGIAFAHGLPLLLDFGVLLDLLLALFVLAWLTGHVRDAWGHVDADQLNGLRG